MKLHRLCHNLVHRTSQVCHFVSLGHSVSLEFPGLKTAVPNLGKFRSNAAGRKPIEKASLSTLRKLRAQGMGPRERAQSHFNLLLAPTILDTFKAQE